MIDGLGRVGTQEADPTRPLHVGRSATIETDLDVGDDLDVGNDLGVDGTVTINNSGDNAVLLDLNTERNWQFQQRNTGSSTGLELRSIGGGGNKDFRIRTDGQVEIVRSNAGLALDVFALSGTATARKDSSAFWDTSSDERLKNILGKYEAGLDEIMRLDPIRYRYKKDNPRLRDQGEQIGLSAQKVRDVIPEAVKTDPDGYLLLSPDPILWAMLNAIKEQQEIIERQRLELADRKAEMDAVQSRLSQLETSLQRFQELLFTRLEGKTDTAIARAGHSFNANQ